MQNNESLNSLLNQEPGRGVKTHPCLITAPSLCGEKDLSTADASHFLELGEMYYYGIGQEEDFSEAIKWFRKAAEAGDADAQIRLGEIYYVGASVLKSGEESVRWFRKAALQGEVQAEWMMGFVCHYGRGVRQDQGARMSCAFRTRRFAAASGTTSATITKARTPVSTRNSPES